MNEIPAISLHSLGSFFIFAFKGDLFLEFGKSEDDYSIIKMKKKKFTLLKRSPPGIHSTTLTAATMILGKTLLKKNEGTKNLKGGTIGFESFKISFSIFYEAQKIRVLLEASEHGSSEIIEISVHEGKLDMNEIWNFVKKCVKFENLINPKISSFVNINEFE